MSYYALEWAWHQGVKDHNALCVLLALAHHINDDDLACHPKHETLAEELFISLSSVRRGLGILEKDGVIERIPFFSGGFRCGTNYVLKGYEPSKKQRDLPPSHSEQACVPTEQACVHGEPSVCSEGTVRVFSENTPCVQGEQSKSIKDKHIKSYTPLPPSEPSNPYEDPKWKPNNKGAVTFSSFCEQQGITDGIPLAWRNWVEEVHPDLDADLLFGEFVRYWAKGKGYETARKDWLATFRNSCAQDFVARKCKRKAMPKATSERPLASELGIVYDPDPNVAMSQYLEEIERREREKYHSSEETQRRLNEIYG